MALSKAEKAKRQKQRKHRRNENRKLLRAARERTGLTAAELDQGQVDPVHALEATLSRAYAEMTVASDEVDNLKSDEQWRDTMVGKLPNEWIRLEHELRKEVRIIAGKMMDLNIEDRKTRASELMAAAIAPVIGGILKDLKLTPQQKELAKEAVGAHLHVLEGGREAA